MFGILEGCQIPNASLFFAEMQCIHVLLGQCVKFGISVMSMWNAPHHWPQLEIVPVLADATITDTSYSQTCTHVCRRACSKFVSKDNDIDAKGCAVTRISIG